MTDDTGKVVPLRPPPGRPAAARPARRPSDWALSAASRRAAPAARDLAAAQNAPRRAAYQAAAARQAADRLITTGRVVPARITMALDLRGLDGPDVDTACGTFEGNTDGDVDAWELALAVPTAEQVRLIAALTGFPEAWFYRPIPPGPVPGDGPGFMCGRRGCTLVTPDVVDERGVLLYEGKPRTAPAHTQGALF